jgi:hypothetical protein
MRRWAWDTRQCTAAAAYHQPYDESMNSHLLTEQFTEELEFSVESLGNWHCMGFEYVCFVWVEGVIGLGEWHSGTIKYIYKQTYINSFHSIIPT